MKNTKIDWCDSTLNAVVGCSRGCEYCYARKMNARFGWVEDWNKPQYFPERLKALKCKKPKSIFMDSMSDIAFWDSSWIVRVFADIEANPQHNYIFLTKAEELRLPFPVKMEFNVRKCNVFFGETITNGTYFNGFNEKAKHFLSIEPLLAPVDINGFGFVRQVIIGAETGNRKNKVIPQKEWVTDIVKQCDKHKVRVFMKESLREIMGADFRQDPLIWEVGK